MEKIINEIKERVIVELEKREVSINQMFFEKVDNIKTLSIELDKVGGFDTESITEVSIVINDIIDEMDIDLENYVVDIYSKESEINE